jgi:diguanylate cyclase (GGDEF)-like protein
MPTDYGVARIGMWGAAACGVLTIGIVGLALALGELPAWTAIAILVPTLAAGALASLALNRLRAERAKIVAGAERARRLADQDGLTGIGNYRAFWRALRGEWARAERYGGAFTLAVIDLDDFKRVNDEHGHRVGNDVLRAVARALAEAVRAEDALCRQGGDEFAVVAVAAGTDEASPLAARLAGAVASAETAPEVEWRPRASVGTATYGVAGKTPEEIMEAAEAALAAAKATRHGGGGLVPAMRPAGAGPVAPQIARATAGQSSVRLAMLSSLARALSVARGERLVAETAVAHVAGAVDARSVAVLKRAGEEGRVECLAAGGPPGERPPEIAADEEPLSVALRECRAALSTRALGLDAPDAAPSAPGTRVAAPVLVDDEVWGAILVESERDGAYDSTEVTLVEAMAVQVGRSLSVSRLLHRLAVAGWAEENGSAVAPADPHGRAVAELACRVGESLRLPPEELRDLHLAALFHDVGTVCAPAGLMQKRGHLTPEEFAVVRGHPLTGERLLGSLSGLAPAARIVRSERERFDGLGYPDGLAGAEIPFASRILGACDAFVAMTSNRPYRPALSPGAAQEELRRGSGTQFDPEVVSALVQTLERTAVPAQ